MIVARAREPTVRPDVVDVIRRVGELRSLGLKTIAMTSNGIVLGRMLDDLVRFGLNAVNISLDSLGTMSFPPLHD